MNQKKTILFLETGTHGGGSFVSLFQYLSHMNREAFRPVVCFLNRTPFVEQIEALGIPVHLLKDPLYTAQNGLGRLMLRFMQKLVEFVCPGLRGSLFDHVVHRSVSTGLLGLLRAEHVGLLVMNVQIDRDRFALPAARQAGVPVVSHLRSIVGRGFSPSAAHAANEQVFKFIANSEATKTYWTQKLLRPEKVSVVYNAVPATPVNKVDLTEEFGIPAEAPVVGCVGRLIHIKGQDLLIQAAARLAEEFPTLRVLLVGDGAERSRLEEFSRTCGLSERVVFAGWRDDAMDLTGSVTVVAVPSREEPFGRCVVEGMQAGVPVIGTRVGGIPEIITDGVDGQLVESDDVEGLAAALRKILSDTEWAAQSVGVARKTVDDRFGLSAYVERVEAVYNRALGVRL